MQYIILISSSNYTLANMQKALSEDMDAYLNEDGTVISLKTTGGDISIRRADNILYDFDESELSIIQASLNAPEAYFVNYKDVSEVKSLLIKIANRNDIFIDTDTDLLLTGKEFIHACITKPDWDWLKE